MDKRKLVNGDEKEWVLFTKLYTKMIYRWSIRILRNRDDALEVTQEVFLDTFKGIAKLQDISKVKSWLYTIAYRLCLKKLSDKHSHAQLNPDIPIVDPRQVSPVTEVEFIERVTRALECLTLREREVFVLYYFEGMSYEDIAEMLEIGVETVKVYLSYARNKIQDILSE